MTNTNATNLRKNLFSYLESAIDYNDVINVKEMLLLLAKLNIMVC